MQSCPAFQIDAVSSFMSVAQDDEPVTFRWSIYRRRTPLGVKLTEGEFYFLPCRPCGWFEGSGGAGGEYSEGKQKHGGAGLAPLQQSSERISQLVQHIVHIRRPIKVNG